MTDKEAKIKEKVLLSLLDFLDNAEGERMSPKKAMSVEVSAPDSEKLSAGLDKAKSLMDDEDSEDPKEKARELLDGHSEESEDSDEDRMRALLADSGEEDEEDKFPFKKRR